MTDRPGLRLRTARLSQHRESDGKPWSQHDFLEATAAEGWRPAYKNYLDTERGDVTPKPETWKRYVSFWAGRGIDLDTLELPEPETLPEPPPMNVLSAIEALARAWAAEREASEARFRSVESEMRLLRAQLEAAMSRGRSVPPATTGSGR